MTSTAPSPNTPEQPMHVSYTSVIPPSSINCACWSTYSKHAKRSDGDGGDEKGYKIGYLLTAVSANTIRFYDLCHEDAVVPSSPSPPHHHHPRLPSAPKGVGSSSTSTSTPTSSLLPPLPSAAPIGGKLVLRSSHSLSGNIVSLHPLSSHTSPSPASTSPDITLLLTFGGTDNKIALITLSSLTGALTATSIIDLYQPLLDAAHGATGVLNCEIMVDVDVTCGCFVAVLGGGCGIAAVNIKGVSGGGCGSGSGKGSSGYQATDEPFVLDLRALYEPTRQKCTTSNKKSSSATSKDPSNTNTFTSSTPGIATGFGSITSAKFLHGYNEPTICILHTPRGVSWLGKASQRKSAYHLTCISLSIKQKRSVIIWSCTVLPNDVQYIVPVRMPLGGVVVVAVNSVHYVAGNGTVCASLAVNGYAHASVCMGDLLPRAAGKGGNATTTTSSSSSSSGGGSGGGGGGTNTSSSSSSSSTTTPAPTTSSKTITGLGTGRKGHAPLTPNPRPLPKLRLRLDGSKLAFISSTVAIVSGRGGKLYSFEIHNVNEDGGGGDAGGGVVLSLSELKFRVSPPSVLCAFPVFERHLHYDDYDYSGGSRSRNGTAEILKQSQPQPLNKMLSAGFLFAGSSLGDSTLVAYGEKHVDLDLDLGVSMFAAGDKRKRGGGGGGERGDDGEDKDGEGEGEGGKKVKFKHDDDDGDDDDDNDNGKEEIDDFEAEEAALYADTPLPPSHSQSNSNSNSNSNTSTSTSSTSSRPQIFHFSTFSFQTVDSITQTGPLGYGCSGATVNRSTDNDDGDDNDAVVNNIDDDNDDTVRDDNDKPPPSKLSREKIYTCGYGPTGGLAVLSVPGAGSASEVVNETDVCEVECVFVLVTLGVYLFVRSSSNSSSSSANVNANANANEEGRSGCMILASEKGEGMTEVNVTDIFDSRIEDVIKKHVILHACECGLYEHDNANANVNVKEKGKGREKAKKSPKVILVTRNQTGQVVITTCKINTRKGKIVYDDSIVLKLDSGSGSSEGGGDGDGEGGGESAVCEVKVTANSTAEDNRKACVIVRYEDGTARAVFITEKEGDESNSNSKSNSNSSGSGSGSGTAFNVMKIEECRNEDGTVDPVCAVDCFVQNDDLFECASSNGGGSGGSGDSDSDSNDRVAVSVTDDSGDDGNGGGDERDERDDEEDFMYSNPTTETFYASNSTLTSTSSSNTMTGDGDGDGDGDNDNATNASGINTTANNAAETTEPHVSPFTLSSLGVYDITPKHSTLHIAIARTSGSLTIQKLNPSHTQLATTWRTKANAAYAPQILRTTDPCTPPSRNETVVKCEEVAFFVAGARCGVEEMRSFYMMVRTSEGDLILYAGRKVLSGSGSDGGGVVFAKVDVDVITRCSKATHSHAERMSQRGHTSSSSSSSVSASPFQRPQLHRFRNISGHSGLFCAVSRPVWVVNERGGAVVLPHFSRHCAPGVVRPVRWFCENFCDNDNESVNSSSGGGGGGNGFVTIHARIGKPGTQRLTVYAGLSDVLSGAGYVTSGGMHIRKVPLGVTVRKIKFVDHSSVSSPAHPIYAALVCVEAEEDQSGLDDDDNRLLLMFTDEERHEHRAAIERNKTEALISADLRGYTDEPQEWIEAIPHEDFLELDTKLGLCPALPKTRNEVWLLDAGDDWRVLQKVPLDEFEHGVELSVVTLTVEESQAEVKAREKANDKEPPTCFFVAVGTGVVDGDGEDAVSCGRVLLFEIIMSEDEDGSESGNASENKKKHKHKHKRHPMLSLSHEKEVRSGPVTSLDSIQSGSQTLLVVGAGAEITVEQYKDKKLNQIGFYHANMMVLSVTVVKGFLLLADAYDSIYFLVWRDSDKSLTLLSKDYSPCVVYAAGVLSRGGAMSFCVHDDRENLQFFQYAPSEDEGRGGNRLVCRADMHIGCTTLDIQAHLCRGSLIAATANIDSTWRALQSQDTSIVKSDDAQKFGLSFGTLEGGYAVIVPVDDASFRRLYALQSIMANAFESAAGCNVRGWRLYSASTMRGAGIGGVRKNVLDGNLLGKFGNCGRGLQEDLAAAIGTTVELIMDNLVELNCAISPI